MRAGGFAANPIARVVGRNMKRLRAIRGMSQTEMLRQLSAKGWETDVSGVSRREGGDRPITVDQLALIAEVLGVDPWSLATEPECVGCLDSPPPGFTCNACGAGGAS